MNKILKRIADLIIIFIAIFSLVASLSINKLGIWIGSKDILIVSGIILFILFISLIIQHVSKLDEKMEKLEEKFIIEKDLNKIRKEVEVLKIVLKK